MKVLDKDNPESRFFEIVQRSSYPDGEDPFVKTKSLVIKPDGTYNLYALGSQVDCSTLDLPVQELEKSTVTELDKKLSELDICQGNCDEKVLKFVKKRKSSIKYKGSVSAKLDNSLIGGLKNNSLFPKHGTVRHKNCTILVHKSKKRCNPCQLYRTSLLKLAKQQARSEHIVMYILTRIG